MTWLLAYVLVCVLCGLVVILSPLSRLLAQKASPVSNTKLEQTLSELAKRAGLDGVRFRSLTSATGSTSAIDALASVGRQVFLSTPLLTCKDEQLVAFLVFHELAHLHRRDGYRGIVYIALALKFCFRSRGLRILEFSVRASRLLFPIHSPQMTTLPFSSL